MVANVNSFKTEQPANDYKLFLKNLPKFNRKSNVNNFITCFENCMSGAPDAVKASYLLNCLDSEAVDLIMPSLPNRKWTYQDIKDAILSEFYNKEMLTV